MRLSETWRVEGNGIRTCIWCLRDAYVCVLEDRCSDRIQYEAGGRES